MDRGGTRGDDPSDCAGEREGRAREASGIGFQVYHAPGDYPRFSSGKLRRKNAGHGSQAHRRDLGLHGLGTRQKNAMMLTEENSVLIEIKVALNLAETPKIIQCFDISNLSYDHIVAGMVRFLNGKPDKKGYRKFLIRSVIGKNDDFKSMSEVVYRRYSKLLINKEELPDLIIIDGGELQLNSAVSSLNSTGIRIPIIGLAKKNEEIYTYGVKEPLRFDKNSRMMLLIRNIRDSVHNYVLAYNKKRRQMQVRDELKKT